MYAGNMNSLVRNSKEDFIYAIVFDLEIGDIRETHGDIHDRTHFEIRKNIETLSFNQTQGNSSFARRKTDWQPLILQSTNFPTFDGLRSPFETFKPSKSRIDRNYEHCQARLGDTDFTR